MGRFTCKLQRLGEDFVQELSTLRCNLYAIQKRAIHLEFGAARNIVPSKLPLAYRIGAVV